MDKELKGTELPKEASEQPKGASKVKTSTRIMGEGKGNEGATPGIPGEKGGKMYHEVMNDKFCSKLTK